MVLFCQKKKGKNAVNNSGVSNFCASNICNYTEITSVRAFNFDVFLEVLLILFPLLPVRHVQFLKFLIVAQGLF
jgi:hypothetical protein